MRRWHPLDARGVEGAAPYERVIPERRILMNKSELIAAVAQRSGVEKKQTDAAIRVALDIIADALARGEKVQLSGFGSFEVKRREARRGRDIRTGEPTQIPAAKIPVFIPSKSLRDSMKK